MRRADSLARLRRSSSESLLSLEHSLLLPLYPHLFPPQSSLTLCPLLVTPYLSQRHDWSLMLLMLLGLLRENAVPLDELSSDSSDGLDAYLLPLPWRSEMRVAANRSSNSSTGDVS